MTGRYLLNFLYLPALLLYVLSFAISPEAEAKPDRQGRPGNGKAERRLSL